MSGMLCLFQFIRMNVDRSTNQRFVIFTGDYYPGVVRLAALAIASALTRKHIIMQRCFLFINCK